MRTSTLLPTFQTWIFVPIILIIPFFVGTGWALELPNTVAVIGTTGRLGREAIRQLSQQGIATRCLVRNTNVNNNSNTNSNGPSLELSLSTNDPRTKVISELRALPGVELVPGDINDRQSLVRLVQGTSACLALHGPTAPKPFIKALLPPLYPETDPQHPKQINYVGIQTLLSVMAESSTCRHLVRITGKGESPWSIFSILINVFSGVAKGWNYEGEQLIRSQKEIKYTIIRPGIMKESTTDETSKNTTLVLGLRDNGNDMKVSVVSYEQIANLTIQVLTRPNCQRTTLTAMNVQATTTTTTTTECLALDEIQTDTRAFPPSLIAEHKKAARFGSIVLLGVSMWLLTTVVTILRNTIQFITAKL